MCLYVGMWMQYVYMSVGICRSQTNVSNSLKLKLQAVVDNLQVLETEI